jgi:hypothetical protein
METLKFIHLYARQLRMDDLAGLAAETVTLGRAQTAALGVLGIAKLDVLSTNVDHFISLLNKAKGSPLTPSIKAEDKKRDTLFAEIKRTSKAASKSSVPATAAAGAKLWELLKSFWNINKEPMMSQTVQIHILADRYSADTDAVAAAGTLGLEPVMAALFAANNTLAALYNERENDLAAVAGPPASSYKDVVVVAYDDFCETVRLTLSAFPTAPLQLLFNELNDVRRKYISRLPKPLNEKYTSVEPIPMQPYTGAPVTPLPKVFFQTEKETIELQFAKDFDVSYRNNTDVGEAKLSIHGKGKYTGRYDTTFHIIMNDEL